MTIAGVSERAITTFPVMGARATLCVPAHVDPQISDAVRRMLVDLHERLTVNGPPSARARSQVEAINAAAGRSPVEVDPDVYQLVREAVMASRNYRGSFNALIGPVVKAWRIGFQDARVPSRRELEGLLALTDPGAVELDDVGMTVFLAEPGMRLDLGAIAKGYAADRAAEMYRSHGVLNGLVDLGGNVVAMGGSDLKQGQPWRVGIQSPFAEPGVIVAVLSLADASAVTSGIYERVLESGGRRYHHMIDPLTGYPFETDLASVTVVSASSMTADLWATIAQRGGLSEGMAIVEQGPGLEAIFVTRSGRIEATSGCAPFLQLVGNQG